MLLNAIGMKLKRTTLLRRMKLTRRRFRDKRRKAYWHFRHGIAIKWAPANFPPKRYCPICEQSSLYFLPASRIAKLVFHYLPDGRFKDAQCPYCSSAARQRLFFYWITKNLPPPSPQRVLHIGPGGVTTLISKMKDLFGNGYVTTDLCHPAAQVLSDITSLAFPSEVFDIIYCSHVLEHVRDDRKAMQECRRVLRFGGRAIFMVPVASEKTFEDWTITDPSERAKVFGRKDHVRLYGPDFHDRLSDAGFQVEMFRAEDLMEKEEMKWIGLARYANEEILFVCRR